MPRATLSSVEVTQHFLARIESQKNLGAFLATDADVSLAQARAADARLAAGERTPLLGVPLAHKDVFVTRDFPSTAGSKMLENYRSPFDATVVRKLAEAGMVTLGKLNCDEFAMGSANENSAYAPVRNPWDAARVPGGSSGGSAAAVAARMVPAATGTDTGGSIRQPASLSSITGIKPTYGRCSRYGMVAFASSLDQAGPMAKSALDCALLLSAMAGPDPDRDSTSLDRPAEDYATELIAARARIDSANGLKGLKIGLPRQFFGAGCAPDVLAAVRAALAEFEKLGATLVDVELPLTELSIPVYYVIAPAEASSNLSRFDGVRYGHRAAQYNDLNDMYRNSRSEGFGDEVTRRIMIGTYVLSHGYYDAYYLKAQKIRRLIAEDFQKAFAQCDIIAGPVSPTVAWKLGEKSRRPGSELPGRHLHPVVEPGRPARHERAGWLSALILEMGACRSGLQLIGNYFQGSAVAGRSAPISAGDRLA